MSLLIDNDIEYPCTVTVKRPNSSFMEDGSYTESFDTIIEDMTADIQLSLKVRNLIAEDETGISDSTVWMMYCIPLAVILVGDHVTDGTRTFVIDAVADWGSHTECIMRKVGI